MDRNSQEKSFDGFRIKSSFTVKSLKNITEAPRLTKFQVIQFHTYKSFIKELKINIKSDILENRAEFFLEQNARAMRRKWRQKYCRLITQVVGSSCCSRSCSIVLEYGFQLDSVEYARHVRPYLYTLQPWRRTFHNKYCEAVFVLSFQSFHSGL